MKRFYKIFASWFLCLFLVFSQFIVSFADVNSLMISTGSNALMTLELDDSDYMLMSPRSSLGSVNNTVDLSQVYFTFWVVNPNTNKGINIVKMGSVANNKISVKLLESDILEGYYLSNMGMHLKNSGRDALPPSGKYKFSFDLSNQFSYSFDGAFINMEKLIDNAQTVASYKEITQYAQFSSGEVYCPGVVIDLKNVNAFYVNLRVQDYASQKVRNLDGDAAFRFELSTASSDVTIGVEQSSQDYQNDVSGSLSDLSSSVDTMTDEISGVTEAIRYLQGAMEPHYSNVLTQLHHITEQLHAFYDQIYNNIHLKEYALWQDIKTAIENIDLEVNVNLDKLKTSIDNMSQAVQNKLQSVSDTITGGYDNSGLESDKSELDGVLNQYEQAEEDLFDDAKGNINDFEFDTPLEQFTGPLSDVSYFLSGLFDAMGPMNVIITFSLTLTIAMVMIGWYRFKGGR